MFILRLLMPLKFGKKILASHSKYICCSYHEPKFLQPILSILFNVCDSKVVKRCENRSGDRVKSCSMESSDPNFVYLYVCVPIFEGKEDQKSIGCIRTEIEMYIDNYYKHTATYSSTIDQIDLRLRWENLVESELFIKNDGLYSQASRHGDLQKLPIDKVYNLVIDDKLNRCIPSMILEKIGFRRIRMLRVGKRMQLL